MKKRIFLILSIIIIIVLAISIYTSNLSQQSYKIVEAGFGGNIFSTVSGKELKKLICNKDIIEKEGYMLYDEFFKEIPEDCGHAFVIHYSCIIEKAYENVEIEAVIDVEFTKELEELIFAREISETYFSDSISGGTTTNTTMTYYGVTKGKSLDVLRELFANVEGEVRIQFADRKKVDCIRIDSFVDNFNDDKNNSDTDNYGDLGSVCHLLGITEQL